MRRWKEGIVNLTASDKERMRVATRKACLRAAKASIALQKYDQGRLFCVRSLALTRKNHAKWRIGELSGKEVSKEWDAVLGHVVIDPEWDEESVKSITDTWFKANDLLEQEQEMAKKKGKEQERLVERKAAIEAKARNRGAMIGASLFQEMLDTQKVGTEIGGESGDAILWPLLLIYQEFRQSDFLRQCEDSTTIRQHLQTVFNTQQPPPPWDPEREYRADTAAVYFISYQAPIKVHGEYQWMQDEHTGEQYPKRWTRVEVDTSLQKLVGMEGHVLPGGCIVLHVVRGGSAWERHMIDQFPGDFIPGLPEDDRIKEVYG
mmetsp:Transcript_40726/g.63591  ORF Transcript_40726/g.63591 Transcript_40726/m.63591 type:complete len:319 (-) Transcript_40726:814-1770(-)